MAKIHKKIITFATSIGFLLFCGSKCAMGPPLPTQHVQEILIKEKIDPAIIQKILDRSDMSWKEFEFFSRHRDENVRFLVANNWHTPQDILSNLAKDSSDLVMQAVTRNPMISDETLQYLLKNPTLLKLLVGNPKLPEEKILEIYRNNTDISLTYFAINPNCPQEIKEAMKKSNDPFVKVWVESNTNRDIPE